MLGTIYVAQFRRQVKIVEQILLRNEREVESGKAQVCVVYCFQRTCTQVKEREDIVDDSDEAVGYENDVNKSAVNEEYPIDAVRRIRRYMMHFEEDFLLVHKEVAEQSGREELQVEEEAVDGGDEY